MRRRSKNQLPLQLVPGSASISRVAVSPDDRELVEALAELLLDASQARLGSERRAGDEREDHG